MTLAFLDAADVILQVITYDSTTIRNTISVSETFRAIGYPASKVQYVLNRADSAGGLDPGVVRAAIGRDPEHTIVSDGHLVVEANNQGMPFVLAAPDAQISGDVRADGGGAHALAAPGRGAGLTHGGRPAHRAVRLRRRGAHGAPGSRSSAAGRIDGLPGRQRTGPVRHADGRRGPPVQRRVPG